MTISNEQRDRNLEELARGKSSTEIIDALEDMDTDRLLDHAPPGLAQEIRIIAATAEVLDHLEVAVEAIDKAASRFSLVVHENLGPEFEETRHVGLQIIGGLNVCRLILRTQAAAMTDRELWQLPKQHPIFEEKTEKNGQHEAMDDLARVLLDALRSHLSDLADEEDGTVASETTEV